MLRGLMFFTCIILSQEQNTCTYTHYVPTSLRLAFLAAIMYCAGLALQQVFF